MFFCGDCGDDASELTRRDRTRAYQPSIEDIVLLSERGLFLAWRRKGRSWEE